MSVLSKSAYEAKQVYSSNRSADNTEILRGQGVDEETIDLYLSIMAIRHELHRCDRRSLYCLESGDFDSLWHYIKQLQDFVGQEFIDEFDCPIDSDEIEDIYHSDYVAKDYDSYQHFAEIWYSDKIEKLNWEAEKKLAELDKKYGTWMCPSGISRIF